MKHSDKRFWYGVGKKAEGDFVASAHVNGWAVSWNPGKQKNKYTHDMLGVIPLDLKTQKTQWEYSDKMFGIPTDRAITINEKDIDGYELNYPNIIMIIDVRWLGELYTLTCDRARKLIASGKAKRHEYADRIDSDNNGKFSYVFNLDDLDKLTI